MIPAVDAHADLMLRRVESCHGAACLTGQESPLGTPTNSQNSWLIRPPVCERISLNQKRNRGKTLPPSPWGDLAGSREGGPGLRKSAAAAVRRLRKWQPMPDGKIVLTSKMADNDTLKEIDEIIRRVGKARDCDIIAYFGDIDRAGANKVLKLVKARNCKKNVILMLATFGGDANGAYRIARAVQYKYKTAKRIKEKGDPRFSLFVPTYCKSAGTILALGADEIIMAPEAELGPIDVQMRKQDEIGESTSGLTPRQAIQNLRKQSEGLFQSFFRKLRFDSDLGFSTKMASEIASNLTIGLMNPIFGQIDPMRLAEVERMLEISVQYGRRLAVTNLRGEEALARLVDSYPSHGFVIDFEEAKEIFRTVVEPDKDLNRLGELFEMVYSRTLDRDEAFVYYIDPTPEPPPAEPINVPPPDGPEAGPNGQADGQGAAGARRGRRPGRAGPEPAAPPQAVPPDPEGA